MSFAICETCGVEHAVAEGTCAICADERQWVPAEGQKWTTLDGLAASGRRVGVEEVEPGLHEVTVSPPIGIGHHGFLVQGADGRNVLWDPPGYIDEAAVERIRGLGETVAIAASHPHMFGVQVEWSRALGDAPVLVTEPNLEWVARPDPVIEGWDGERVLGPGLTLRRLGGHFPGSCLVHWEAGAGGGGVLLASDTMQANPDRETVTFMRSYPNRIPLSAAVVERLAGAVAPLAFDRLYDNFGKTIDSGAGAAVATSAERYVGWVRGDFDDLT
jgi:hypothetical protein